VGEYVVFARKERGGTDWYLGALTDGSPREVSVALDFLEPETRYCAELYLDGEGAEWRGNPYAMRVEKRWVGQGERLELKMGASGGAAVRFEAEAKRCGSSG
jgi:alpha-glucosidase